MLVPSVLCRTGVSRSAGLPFVGSPGTAIVVFCDVLLANCKKLNHDQIRRRRPSPVGGFHLPPFGADLICGPVAHLGYFRQEFVMRRGWLSERAYADLVALLPVSTGASEQSVGMALGLSRAGYAGALAAWAGFWRCLRRSH